MDKSGMSLDAIIKMNEKLRRKKIETRKPLGRPSQKYPERVLSITTENKDRAKLLVSNLAVSVSEDDVEELFLEFGPIYSCKLFHDPLGLSLGTAEVTFHKRGDACTAMERYQGVPLDGRPLLIQSVSNEIPTHSTGTFKKTIIGLSDSEADSGGSPRKKKDSALHGVKKNDSNGFKRKGKGFRGRRRDSDDDEEELPSAKELDEDMDAYWFKHFQKKKEKK